MPSTKPMTRHPAARPREDHGLFGPGSPTWRVWTSPTALIAFQRSIVVETFDPFLAAAVEEQNGVRSDPRGRFERTAHYFQTVAVGDSRAAIEASELLTRVHARATGTEPISGLPYSANDPDSQLWIHVTGWHSNLLCYERFGPGPLSAQDEHRYWAECAIAAELQTCDPAAVPRTRSEVRDYYATIRPRLCVSEHASALLTHFLRTPPRRENAELWATSRLLAVATIATIPRWMRRLGGFDRPAAVDAAIVPVARLLTRALAAPDRQLSLLEHLAPAARHVVEPALRGEPPLRPETVTPTEARARHGDRLPKRPVRS
jgi:uncharacterized protein (DUF2236 family)